MVALRVTVRDLDTLEDLSGVLAAHPSLNVHGVTWHVDWDNSAWPQVRAAAIGAAIGKARDYAAALGATVRHVEHIADVGLLGGDTAPYQPDGFVTAKAFSDSGHHPRGPGADSRSAGTHRDHRGSLPHYRGVPAKRFRPQLAIGRELTNPARLLHPGISGPGRLAAQRGHRRHSPSPDSQIAVATRNLNLDLARSLAT